MINWIKHNKQGLVVGIIGSVIGTIVLSPLAWIIQRAPVFGNSFISFLVDLIYINTSVVSKFSFGEFFATFLLMMGISPFLLLFDLLIRTVKKKIDSKKKNNAPNPKDSNNADVSKTGDKSLEDEKSEEKKAPLQVRKLISLRNYFLCCLYC